MNKNLLKKLILNFFPELNCFYSTSLFIKNKYLKLKFNSFTNDYITHIGRVLSIRNKNRFFVIFDYNRYNIQIHICLGYINIKSYILSKFISINDIIEVKGNIYLDKIGNISILAKDIKILCIFNLINLKNCKFEKNILNVKLRSMILFEIRRFLSKNGFIEIETPIFHKIENTFSDVKVFTTYYNETKNKFQLRISPEFYLKKFLSLDIVDGVYEIGKSFRNEGISYSHIPEFSLIEIYSFRLNFFQSIKFVENLINNLNILLNNSIVKFKIISICELIREKTGFRMELINDFSSRLICKYLKLNNNLNFWNEIIIYILNFLLKSIYEPIHITWFPLSVSPFSRPKNVKSRFAIRFETYWNNMEIINAYSELNNPEMQILKCNTIDVKNNLIQSLNFGLRPTFGIGIGIDRLIMCLLKLSYIKDAVIY